MPLSPALSADQAAAPAAPNLNLFWVRCSHDPVSGHGVSGVYVICRTGARGRECLVVGETRDIATELARTIRESHIAGYAASGELDIAWAAVASLHRPGIAGYLGATLSPTLAGPASVARQIPVNLPS